MRTLHTTSEVIEALGGIAKVAELTERKYNAAQNWKRFATFPPDTFIAIRNALERQNLTAPASLWRMKEPA